MLYPQSDTRPARIFISHAEEEKDFAKAIVVEEPSDLKGIVYTKLDKDGAWKYRLVKELREQGYDVSSDSL